jgi:organic hydroperoxide reductase OsmC/OhrA
MIKEYIYQVQTTWTGERQADSYGREFRADIVGKLPLFGSADVNFGGDIHLYNPEDLLLISLSACHLLSYLALCAKMGITVLSYSDNAEGKMSREKGKMRFTEVILHPHVTIAAGDDLQKAIDLHQKAHDICFIANSVAFPVLNQPIVSLTD